MLEEACRDQRGLQGKELHVIRRLNAKPIGHIYSVLVEELEIEIPHLSVFIERLQWKHSEIVYGKSDLRNALSKICTMDHIQALSHVLVEDGMRYGTTYEKMMIEALGYKDQGVLGARYFRSKEYAANK